VVEGIAERFICACAGGNGKHKDTIANGPCKPCTEEDLAKGSPCNGQPGMEAEEQEEGERGKAGTGGNSSLCHSLPVSPSPSRALSRSRSRSLSLTHTHVSSLAYPHSLTFLPNLFSLSLYFSQLAYIRCGSQETVRFLRMPDPTIPLWPKRPQNNISKVQNGEESSSRNKRCQMELEKASVDLATSGDVIKQQTLCNKLCRTSILHHERQRERESERERT
jgi:hypothetical protein